MIPIVFINCKEQPFLDQIMTGQKKYETRTKNMLRKLIGEKVLLAETGHGRAPFVRAEATIDIGIEVFLRHVWETTYREPSCIAAGSKYDWQEGTKKKFLYLLKDVHPVKPFYVSGGIRHGRSWMEIT